MKYINYRRIIYKYKYRFILVFALIFVVILNIVIGIMIEPALHISAETEVCNLCSKRINECISKVLSKEEYQNVSFTEIKQTSDGEVCSVETNTVLLNKIVADIVCEISFQNEKNYVESFKVPLGQLSKNVIVSGKGPSVTVNAYETSGIKTNIKSEVISAGLNQSVFRITLLISEDIEISFPFSDYNYNLETEYILSETAVNGKVPQNYTKIETSRN